MTAPATNTETAIVIYILRKNAERLRRENAAHLQVAINIQDTLTKSTARYKAKIDKLKELIIPNDCEWRWVYGIYKTSCKARTGSLYVDSIAEHNMKYCPYCGNKIIEVAK